MVGCVKNNWGGRRPLLTVSWQCQNTLMSLELGQEDGEQLR